MLVPFYMLEGNIEKEKEVVLPDGSKEITYKDEHGNTAVILKQGR